jgi:hypothetical protein
MRVRREKILRSAVQVSEIAPPASGDQYLLANAIGVFQHDDAAPALPGGDGAHQSGGASAQDHRMVRMDHETVSGFELRVSSA